MALQKLDIKGQDGDQMAKHVLLTTSSPARGNAHCLKPGVDVNVEIALKISKEKGALTDGRLAAIEEEIVGLKVEVSIIKKEVVGLRKTMDAVYHGLVAAKMIDGAASSLDDPLVNPRGSSGSATCSKNSPISVFLSFG